MCGEDHPRAVLTTEQVKEIKTLLSKGMESLKIAKMYKTNRANISSIKSGRCYSDISSELNDVINTLNKKEKLTIEEVVEIKILIQEGAKNKDILKLYSNIDASSISNIRTEKTWKKVQIPVDIAKYKNAS